MRSHGGSGEGTRLARAAAVAGDVAHRAASTGGFSRWLIEPFGHSYHARIAAGTFAGVEPLLPRRGCAAVAYGAAHDRGLSLLELLEILDPLVVPQAIDEIGMSGDRTAVPPLIVMAEAGEAQ